MISILPYLLRRRMLSFGAFFGFYACITPIDTSLENQTNSLIVDAELTNSPGPYFVRLRLSSSFNSPPRVTGASVWIVDDLGNRLDFDEIADGEYRSDSTSDFIGQIGRTYVLHVETLRGDLVESEPETMVDVPPIESMLIEPSERLRISDLGNEIVTNGFEVVLNTRSIGSQGTFLRYDYRGVFVAKTPNPTLRNISCFILDEPPREYLNVFGTTIGEQLPILGIPIEFFRPTFKFDTLYFLITRQFSLNEKAFDYWDAVDRQRNSTGSIFDPTPSTIINNLRDINDPENEILGYFTVSGVTENSFEILRDELDPLGLRFEVPYTECFGFGPPAFCDSCNLIPNSSILFPEVIW